MGSAWMRAFDCCQNRTSPVSRKYQPLPTTPCPSGALPVNRLACAVQVTAGATSRSERFQPDSARAFSRGARASRRPVRPTALTSTRGAMALMGTTDLGRRTSCRPPFGYDGPIRFEIRDDENFRPMQEYRDRPFPPYAFVPGGPWPHPTSHPEGHSRGRPHV